MIKHIPDSMMETMLEKKVFDIKDSPVPFNRLRLLKLPFINFDNHIKIGQLIVLDSCAQHIVNIFDQLFAIKFPIHKMNLITDYDGDDYKSMKDNNSSCHNCRKIVRGKGKMSIHSYGTAIDINPEQNPFIVADESTSKITCDPSKGIYYINRRNYKKGMVEKIVPIFTMHGFEWGGHWDLRIDYHHFQISRQISKLLVAMDSEESILFFDQHVKYYNITKRQLGDDLLNEWKEDKKGNMELVEFYKLDTTEFYRILDRLLTKCSLAKL